MGGGSGSAGGTSGRVRVRVRVRVLDRCVGLPCGGLLLPVGLLAGCGLRGEVRGPLLGCEVEARLAFCSGVRWGVGVGVVKWDGEVGVPVVAVLGLG